MAKACSSEPRVTPLTCDFFARDTLTVARESLGQTLVCRITKGLGPLSYRIVETEAYTQDDPACHAFKGNKGRGATLYKAPGLSYVYLIYGMYHCLNVVTEPEGKAGAVLFRALEPLSLDYPQHTHGPGRLCKALGITREHNEQPMTNEGYPLVICEGNPVDDGDVVTTTRIGISQAQDYPWRFYVKSSRFVSVK